MPQTAIKSHHTKYIRWAHSNWIFHTSLKYLPRWCEEINQLLETLKSQFAKDEASIETTHLTKMQINTGDSEPVLQRPYPNAVKQWLGKKQDKQTPWCTSNLQQQLQLVSTIIVVLKGDGWEHLLVNYRALNKVTQKFVWPMPRVEDIFSKLNGAKYCSTLNLHTGYHHILPDEDYSQNSLSMSFWKIWVPESSFWNGTSTSIFPRTNEWSIKSLTLLPQPIWMTLLYTAKLQKNTWTI